MPWDNTPAARAASAKTYNSAWRKARRAQLQRDNHQCQLRLPGCTRKATQVDHAIGAAADPTHQHLRSACAPCHRQVTAQQGGGYRQPARTADPEPRPATRWL